MTDRQDNTLKMTFCLFLKYYIIGRKYYSILNLQDSFYSAYAWLAMQTAVLAGPFRLFFVQTMMCLCE